MPFVCPTTGEMAECFDCGADITCECARGSLATVTVIKADSGVTKKSEQWYWKDDAQLDAQETAQQKIMKAKGAHMVPPADK